MQEISGDKPLSRKEQMRYVWIFLKRLPGLFASVTTYQFIPHSIPLGEASLFRKYVDAFISEVVPELIPRGQITVFDIGCGSGYIRKILERLGYSGSYTGLDVIREKRFDDFDSPSFLSSFVSSPIETYLPDRTYDFVTSNTSFEHVEDDAKAATKARELAGRTGVEVHIMPSWWSFFLYLWHGYRHYTPGSLKQLFEGSEYQIYRLGGAFSFKSYFLLIMLPERYLGLNLRRSSWYPRIAEKIIRLDRFLPFCPIGYAVVIKHV